MGVKRYLDVMWVCISLLANDDDMLLTLRIFSGKTSLQVHFAILNWLVCLLLFSTGYIYIFTTVFKCNLKVYFIKVTKSPPEYNLCCLNQSYKYQEN